MQSWHHLLREATDALVRMDADRLEELVRCCADLNRQMQSVELPAGNPSPSMRRLAQEVSAHQASIAVMGRLLAETRANLRVLTRLHLLRLKAAESAAESQHAGVWHVRPAGVDYGDN